jgi:hypothetical protein
MSKRRARKFFGNSHLPLSIIPNNHGIKKDSLRRPFLPALSSFCRHPLFENPVTVQKIKQKHQHEGGNGFHMGLMCCMAKPPLRAILQRDLGLVRVS